MGLAARSKTMTDCLRGNPEGLRYATAVVVAAASAALLAQQPSGVFTAAQANAGRTAYQASCAGCHMPDLAGRNEAPPLAGGTFMNAWRTRTTRDLVEYMSATMPPNVPSLAADQYLAIASYILQSNGAAPGTQPLTPTTAAQIGAIASGSTTAATSAPTTTSAPAVQPPGSASPAQRGITT